MTEKHIHLVQLLGVVILLTAIFFTAGCKQEALAQSESTIGTEAAEEVTQPAPVQQKYDLGKDVLYFGRTYEKSRIHWFNWSGSGFSIRFKGSSVLAEFYSNAPDTRNLAYLKVYVDGVAMQDIMLKDECQIVTLAEGLDPEQEHTVEVRKRTNARSSTAGVGRIVLMDGTILPPAQEKERLIEFLGDSLTVGYVASKDGKTATAWSTTTEDVTGTYCPQIAQAFGAEYQTVAISGRGIVRNNGGDAETLFPDIYRELDLYNNPGVAYEFDRQPDVIVINLGTNDESEANKELSREEFRQGLLVFLKEVRQYHPHAHIIYAYGLVRIGLSDTIASVVEELRSEGDSKLHYLQLEQCQAWELNLNHTVSSAYTSRGEALIDKISEITGWQSGE